jgi:hypothetical protein
MTSRIFSEQKYIEASNKALDFIKEQMRTGHNNRLPVSYLVPLTIRHMQTE